MSDSVVINNLSFSYKSSDAISSSSSSHQHLILNGINARIPSRQIYALLGPSGCGKTTLLKIILGLLSPHDGNIVVLNDKPGLNCRQIGHMPQEAALYQSFSVRQNLRYFGQLYKMSEQAIVERTKHLCDLLAISDIDRKIKCLSGGQQKRVSLAVALIHSPKLVRKILHIR